MPQAYFKYQVTVSYGVAPSDNSVTSYPTLKHAMEIIAWVIDSPSALFAPVVTIERVPTTPDMGEDYYLRAAAQFPELTR